MAVELGYLADKSVRTRIGEDAVWAVLAPLIEAGSVATCGVVELQLLWSEWSGEDITAARKENRAAFRRLAVAERDFERAEEVIEGLARRGFHRSAGLPSLLVAAAAERKGLIVLHYDGAFDLIAEITRQPMQWVVPKGSIA